MFSYDAAESIVNWIMGTMGRQGLVHARVDSESDAIAMQYGNMSLLQHSPSVPVCQANIEIVNVQL